LLSTLKNQQGFKNIEIIVVDSGSTDRTLEIARNFKSSIIEISSERFSHSYARNLGAEYSTADFILFTVQDALPPSVTWLRDLHHAIEAHGVIAVSCAESPRQDSDLFYRALCWTHQRFLNVQDQDRILQNPKRKNYGSLRANANVQNIACLIKRNIFLKYRFQGDFAEDMDLGLRLIKNGYKMAFLSSSRIIHSHNRPAYYHLKRGYVDCLFLLRLFPSYEPQVVEAKGLMEDILVLYKTLTHLLKNELSSSSKVCSIQRLSRIVRSKLQEVEEYSQYPGLAPGKCDYADDFLHSFIETVSREYLDLNADQTECKGSLRSGLLSFASLMIDYMQGIYEELDEPLLEDFRNSLIKAFAFNIGVCLASGTERGSTNTRRILHGLSADLHCSV